MDYFIGTPYGVEVEKDLSVKRQLLDVVIVRKEHGAMVEPLPDGLDNFSDHNLLTYKSEKEPLDAWTIDELLGHSVNYRKQVLPRGQLLPLSKIKLYGITTRFPKKLGKEVELKQLQAGVYETVWGAHRIRILVLKEMPEKPQNAVWEMFSGERRKVRVGLRAYQPKTPDIQGVFMMLSREFGVEGTEMAYTWEDFRKDYARENLDALSPEERLEGLSPEEVLRKFSPDERLKGLRPSERLEGLRPSERLEGLSLEEIEAYLRRRRTGKRRGSEE